MSEKEFNLRTMRIERKEDISRVLRSFSIGVGRLLSQVEFLFKEYFDREMPVSRSPFENVKMCENCIHQTFEPVCELPTQRCYDMNEYEYMEEVILRWCKTCKHEEIIGREPCIYCSGYWTNNYEPKETVSRRGEEK
ncbi:MAG: hypothetical protein GY853_00695 [PVC group bacterium]|nr:hypothetical protein [PVC group bacterium]